MKLMKATLRRLWQLTRATSIVVGLAVMVALVGGVVSLALAKPPVGGVTPPAGGGTAAGIFKGVVNTAATTTTLINSGTGAALDLQVQPGNPPLTVNSDAGTATHLSADTVDGKDATAFVSATNGKAPDSELLDGKDSTEFLGASAKAADSDKLDGKDSTDFAPASTPTAFAAGTGSVTIPDDQSVVVVSKNVPAGSYAISATVRLVNKDDNDSSFAGCSLHPGLQDRSIYREDGKEKSLGVRGAVASPL